MKFKLQYIWLGKKKKNRKIENNIEKIENNNML